jgi:hypothetical protein
VDAAGFVCAAVVERDEVTGFDSNKFVVNSAVHGATFEILEICMFLLLF